MISRIAGLENGSATKIPYLYSRKNFCHCVYSEHKEVKKYC